MKKDKLLSPAIDWQHDTIAQRIDACASMLFVHGYIPLSTREKIGNKLDRQLSTPDQSND